ncbi:TPA: hypothetical protein OUE92_001726 [Serratia marcescens]|nr:hypothetical protein [Serratia marcescens]
MKKYTYLIIITIFSAIAALIVFFSTQNSITPSENKQCHAYINMKVTKNEHEYTLLAYIYLRKEPGEIVFRTKGLIRDNSTTYIINRKTSFSDNSKTFFGEKKMILKDESVLPADNVPDSVWINNFLPIKKNESMHHRYIHITDDTLYINGFQDPYLVCVINE